MKRTDDVRDSFAKLQQSSMPETCGRSWKIVLAANRLHHSVECELSQAENRSKIFQRVYFAGEITGAVRRLICRRLIVGRSTLNRRCDVRTLELQSIIDTSRRWLVCKTRLVQSLVEKIPTTIACEDSACPIPTMGRGS